MLQVLICALLLFIVLCTCLLELVWGITWIVKKTRGTSITRLNIRLKRNALVLGGAVVLTACLVLISQLAANTPRITGPDGEEIPGSISELEQLTLNGRKQWISVRGTDRQNPVLLFLAGGPGGTQMAAVRHELAALEESFVVVGWDQPGSGKSYGAGRSLTVDDYVADGLALTQYLREQFFQEKIYLVGESWGSALGIFLADAQPEYYHAFIGTGQMVDFLATEKIDYEKALELAAADGDDALQKKLEKNGPPPYYGADVTWKSAAYLNYLSSQLARNPAIRNGGYQTFRDLFSPEYGLWDKLNFFRGIVNTFNQVYPQLYGTDLRADHPRLEIPVYFFLGRHDLNAPTTLVEDYVRILDAPQKQIVWFEHSGHSPWINEPSAFVENLLTAFGAA